MPACGRPQLNPTRPRSPRLRRQSRLSSRTREERDIRFENESVTAVFTTRGGALKSWRLKKYQDAARQPLELIPANAPAGTVHPFTLSVPDAAASATLAQALFKASATEISAASAPATLTFEYQDASGLTARKEFSFFPASPYVINFSATVSQGGKELVPTVHWGPALGSGIVASSRTLQPSSAADFLP